MRGLVWMKPNSRLTPDQVQVLVLGPFDTEFHPSAQIWTQILLPKRGAVFKMSM